MRVLVVDRDRASLTGLTALLKGDGVDAIGIQGLPEAVDALRADIRHVETTLSGDVRSVHAEVQNLESSLRAEMHELNDDTKRHMNVVAESLRDDIRMIAEGVVALSVKVDSLSR